jgi:hypothetical protein
MFAYGVAGYRAAGWRGVIAGEAQALLENDTREAGGVSANWDVVRGSEAHRGRATREAA